MATLLLAPVIAGANAFWAAALTFAASAVDSYLFAPKQNIEGQRMDGLQLQDSAYGGMIPITYGRVRVTGNIIYAGDFIEHKHKQRVGKGGKKTVTSYTYSISFAVGIAKGTITAIGRIWADGKVIATGDIHGDYNIRIYHGTEDQMPDPYIEAKNGGIGTTPAYRGLAYIVFEDMDLTDFGGRIPQLQFEIFKEEHYIVYGSTIEDANKWESVEGKTNEVMRYAFTYLGIIYDINYTNCNMTNSIFCVSILGDVTEANESTENQDSDHKSTFKDCDLTGTIFYISNIFYTEFINCKIDQAYLDTTNIGNVYAEEAGDKLNGRTAVFKKCLIRGLKGHVSNIRSAFFIDCDMRNAEAKSEFNWELSVFKNCDLRGSIFRCDNLVNCKFESCKLNNVKIIVNNQPYDIKGRLHMFFGCQFIDCDFDTPSAPYIDQYTYQCSLESTIVNIADQVGIQTGGLSFTSIPSIENKNLVRGLGGEQAKEIIKAHEIIKTCIEMGINGDPQYVDKHTEAMRILAHISTNIKDYIGKKITVNTIPKAVFLKKETQDSEKASLFKYLEGYLITNQCSFREVVEGLQATFLFGVVDEGGLLKFIPAGMEETVIIPEEDFGAAADQNIDKLTITSSDIRELPTQVNINFFDIERDYQNNTSKSRILWHKQYPNSNTINTKMVVNKSYADYLANQILSKIWINRTKYAGQLGNKWSGLSISDVIETTINGIQRRIQITKTDYDGNIMKFEGEEYKAPAQAPEYVQYNPTLPEPIIPANLECMLLDIPNLLGDDTENGFYAAAAATKNWRPVYLFVSDDAENSSFSIIGTIDSMATMGTALTKLNYGPAHFFDRGNTVIVELAGNTLTSVSEDDMLINNNAALLGNEIIQFANAELIKENTYRLSNLLRGRKGTEWAIDQHTVGEKFLLLEQETIVPESIHIADIGRKKQYKYQTYNGSVENTINFTYQGICYKPYSVCHISGKRNNNGDLCLTWIRRTRANGEWRSGMDAALSEAFEKYEVDIVKNNETIRTIKTTEQTAIYTAAEQTADFGIPQSEIKIKIYQMSDKVGRGYESEETL